MKGGHLAKLIREDKMFSAAKREMKPSSLYLVGRAAESLEGSPRTP